MRPRLATFENITKSNNIDESNEKTNNDND